MEIKLQQKLKTKLILSPRHQIFLTLITLPVNELVEYVKNEAEENPFLEIDYDVEKTEFINYEIKIEETPREHILRQFHLSTSDERIIEIGDFIIENLEDDGYLKMSIEEIQSYTGGKKEEIEKAIEILHSLEPPGIGARDLRECLLLQVERIYGRKDLLYKIVEKCWELLTHRKYREIGKKLRVSSSVIREKMEEIKKLNPHPLSSNLPRYSVIPEGKVVKGKDKLEVQIEEKIFPFLKINSLYQKYIKNPALTEKEKKFLEMKLKKARMLLEMVEKRQKTLKNIFQEIVNHQKDYFEGGNLVPLKEKEIAEKVGVSISTVSRAINRKYLLTPRGIVKIKDLFSGGIGNMSRKFIVEKIKEILKNEKKPLSDREIAEKLKEYGIDISTRTVNKYRNKEGILNSYLR